MAACSNLASSRLELDLWRSIQPCREGPPHRCDEYYLSTTEEEFQTLDEIERRSREQLASIGGLRRRPDLHLNDDEEEYIPGFYCSLLREIRKPPENLRNGNSDSQGIPCLPSSPLPSLREEPGRSEDNETVQISPADSSTCSSESFSSLMSPQPPTVLAQSETGETNDFVSLLPFYLSSELPVSTANNMWMLRLMIRYKIQDFRHKISPQMLRYHDMENITTHGLSFQRIPWIYEPRVLQHQVKRCDVISSDEDLY